MYSLRVAPQSSVSTDTPKFQDWNTLAHLPGLDDAEVEASWIGEELEVIEELAEAVQLADAYARAHDEPLSE